MTYRTSLAGLSAGLRQSLGLRLSRSLGQRLGRSLGQRLGLCLGLGLGMCLSLSPGLARAQVAFSPEATLQCLREGPGMGTSCIGVSADQCMADTDGGWSTYGMSGCLDAERGFWDGRLNSAYRARMSEAKAADAEAKAGGWQVPGQATALRDMQRAWIVFRDKSCDYEGSLWAGGTGAGPAIVGCLMRLTGEQALYLESQGQGG